jgi:hypothetical protein
MLPPVQAAAAREATARAVRHEARETTRQAAWRKSDETDWGDMDISTLHGKEAHFCAASRQPTIVHLDHPPAAARAALSASPGGPP